MRVKCGDCTMGEGTEQTNWLWCTRKGKLVHKNGGCDAGTMRPTVIPAERSEE